MKRLWPAIVAVSAAVAACATAGVTTGVRPPDARDGGAVRPAGSWGTAIEVPGLGALNKGGEAYVGSMACPSAGNCAADGRYTDGGRHQQGFVVSESNGRWGMAIEVPGLGTLNKGGNAEVGSVSCGSAGNCATVGYYSDQYRHSQGFVVSESNGHWGMAIEVPGLGTLNKGGNAEVGSVSCASAGNCATVGFYTDGGRHQQGFVVSEKNGAWGMATGVPGLEALNRGGNAEVGSVSCASAGNCTAGGSYTDGGGHVQGFVVSESNGTWGQATGVPGLEALNANGDAVVRAVSCASAGNCAAGGNFASAVPRSDGGYKTQGFVVSESNGVWGQAINVPGLGALNVNGEAYVGSLSCASPGNCSAGGDYDYDYQYGFVVIEKNGVWGQAIDVPGMGALQAGRFTDVNSVSCASPGNCAAGGDYEGASGDFVVSESNGVWGRAINVPGLGALNKGWDGAEVTSVSCAPAGNCAAGGDYNDGHGHYQGFVT
jgi:hypothetical protein